MDELYDFLEEVDELLEDLKEERLRLRTGLLEIGQLLERFEDREAFYKVRELLGDEGRIFN